MASYLAREDIGVEALYGGNDFLQLFSVGFGSTKLVTYPGERWFLATLHGLPFESDARRTTASVGGADPD